MGSNDGEKMGDIDKAAGIKTDAVTCKKAPDLRDGRHMYEIEGKCIYCGELEPGRKAPLQEIPGNEKVKTEPAPKCPGKPPLDSIDIQGLMGAFMMNGRVLAIQARIEGMKVRNAVNKINGHSPEYAQIDFWQAADNITMCVDYLKTMKDSCVIK